jgi:hypothetical protein
MRDAGTSVTVYRAAHGSWVMAQAIWYSERLRPPAAEPSPNEREPLRERLSHKVELMGRLSNPLVLA